MWIRVNVPICLIVLVACSAECATFFTKLNHDDRNSPPLALLYNSYGTYKNGPAFLYINGENHGGSTAPKDYIMDIVNLTGGIAFAIEHRCYSDLDLENRWHNTDIQYCDSENAIKDLVKFVKQQNMYLPRGIKWIALGCSYAGRLAVKMRGLHPDLIFGAWASSALLYEKALIPDFFPVVVDNIRKTCGDYLADTANYMIQVAYSGGTSCVYNPQYSRLVVNMIKNAEYKYKIANFNTTTLEKSCKEVLHSAQYCATDHKQKRTISAIDYYVWKYQECHELGYLQKIQLDGCHDYSIPWTLQELVQSVSQENILMDEILKHRTRILLVYGIDDPWIIASPPRDYKNIKRIDIPGGSHCSDWVAPSDDVEVNKYRREIKKTILSWMKDK